MTLYLVRWLHLTASLVRAENEEELLEILDSAGNPDGCEWTVYGGPLAIDFALPAKWSIRDETDGVPVSPDQIVVEDLGPLAEKYVVAAMDISLSSCEAGADMGTLVLETAFPYVHSATRPLFKIDEGDEILPEPVLRQALHTELARMLKASWRRAALARKDDVVSRLAHEMDLPPALAHKYVEAALADNDELEASGTAGWEERPDPLFAVSNHHHVTDGQPPFVDGDERGRYVGYFVNEHGEQAVFAWDAETGEATVRLGGAGWQAVHRVVDGEPRNVDLTEGERIWIRACWLAVEQLRKHRA